MAGGNRSEVESPKRPRPRARVLVAALVAGLVASSLVPTFASAQEAPGSTSTSTTTTTTTTTKPPPSQPPPAAPTPAPTTLPPAPSTSTPQPSTNVQDNLLLLQQQQQERLAALQAEADALARQMAASREVLDELDLDVENVNELIEEILRKLEDHREAVKLRAVAAYKGDTSYLAVLLDADSPADFLSRVKLLSEANTADKTRIERLEDQKAALEEQQDQLIVLRKQQRQKIAEMEQAQSQLGLKLNQMVGVLSSLPTQQAIAVNGFVFPVTPPFTYSDDFGDYRAGPPVHTHEGNDIFCVPGAPLRASEAGIIQDLRERGLGGKSFWLIGDTGTAYYYAHLSAYYPGIDNGVRVESGQYVGFCGNSGNARTTPHHLHYQIHPLGRDNPPINPYPILKATEQAMIAALGQQLGVGAGTTQPGQSTGVPPAAGTVPGVGTTPTTLAPQPVVPAPEAKPLPVQRAPRKTGVY